MIVGGSILTLLKLANYYFDDGSQASLEYVEWGCSLLYLVAEGI